VVVTASQPAQLQLSGQTSSISCNGQNDGSIQTNVSGGTPGYSYSWNSGATTASIANLPAGNYNLTVMDANGCLITGMYQVIEPLALQTSIQLSGTILQSSTNGGTGTYTYEWSFGGSVVSTAMTVTPDPTQTGYYTLEVTDQNGCIAITTYLYTAVSVEEEQQVAIRLFPNPVEEILWIEGLNGQVYELYDAKGDVVYEGDEEQLDVRSFAKGIYLLKTATSVHKFIKE
jgi:hypothetical protein